MEPTPGTGVEKQRRTNPAMPEKRVIKGSCLSDYCDGLQGHLVPILAAEGVLVGYRLELSLRPNFGAPVSGIIYYSKDPRPYLTQTSHHGYLPADSEDTLLGRFRIAPHESFRLTLPPYRTGNIKALLDLGKQNDTGGGTYLVRIPERD